MAHVQGISLFDAPIGMQFTEVTVWLAIAMTLSVFQISKADGEDEKASIFAGCVSAVSDPVIKPGTDIRLCQSSTKVQVQDQPAVYEGGRAHPAIFVDIMWMHWGLGSVMGLRYFCGSNKREGDKHRVEAGRAGATYESVLSRRTLVESKKNRAEVRTFPAGPWLLVLYLYSLISKCSVHIGALSGLSFTVNCTCMLCMVKKITTHLERSQRGPSISYITLGS